MAVVIGLFIVAPSPFKQIERNDIVLAQPVEQKVEPPVQPAPPKQEPVKQFDPNDRSTWPVCAADEIVRADNGQCAKKPAEPAKVAQTSDPTSYCNTGIPAKDFIYMKESGCRLGATNAGGCYGLGQDCNNVLATACPDWRTNFACQDAFWESYMKRRYGTWEAAKAFWLSSKDINGREVGNWW